MKLERTEDGRVCASDRAIRFVRVRQALRSDGTRGDGWEVRVNRPAQDEVRHVARNLEEATAWARQHWRPSFLEDLMSSAGKSPHAQGLYEQAALGDFPSFCVLLDAVEDAGKSLDKALLTEDARREGLFVGDAPETVEEIREQRRRAVAWVEAHEASFAEYHYKQGTKSMDVSYAAGDFRVCTFHDSRPGVTDRGGRLRAIEAAKQRLEAEGIEAVSQ